MKILWSFMFALLFRILEYERPERAVKLYKQAFDVADVRYDVLRCF